MYFIIFCEKSRTIDPYSIEEPNSVNKLEITDKLSDQSNLFFIPQH